MEYIIQVKKNAATLAQAFVNKDYNIISGGTDNHLMLIDLRNKGISGKAAEAALGKAGITINKNMVPFDDRSPFVTSGIRLGTAAITSRGLKEDQMLEIAEMIDVALLKHDDDIALDKIHNKVKALMESYPLYK